MPRSSARALIAALLVAACSDDGGGGGGGGPSPLDCAWLEGNNCWRTTGALASECLPPVTAAGTFNATNTVCTYSDGTTVTFDQPLTIPIPVDTPPMWSFTISRGGTTCVRYERTEIKRTFTVMEQTYSDMAVGEAGIQVSCPDGTVYKTDDESTITACPGASTRIPREAFFSDTTSVSMELYGAGPDGTRLAIFNCRRP